MRIVGGKYKRKRFTIPSSFNARPTTDFAKENIFNVLDNIIDFENMNTLDLFSGTGGISAELISRGAKKVVAVEQRREHALFIKKIITEIGEIDKLKLINGDVFKYLNAKNNVDKFDFVFADPPYKLEEIKNIPDLIINSGLLYPEAIIVLEHPKTFDFSNHKYFNMHREYGSVNFSIFIAP